MTIIAINSDYQSKMSIKTTNIISYILAGFSILIILFGCFAPIIFTQKGFIDLTDTGQIGDTIGGTMSPIVAIAGVFMTFIAFLMQVNANRIQSAQIKKTLRLNLLEKQMDSRNALQLMSIDIDDMIKHVDATCEEIESFCKKTDANPTGEIPFHFTPKKSHCRYHSINRNHVYNAYASFMSTDKHLEDFKATYSLMDFYSEGLDQLYSTIYKPSADDIMKCKNEIPKAFEELCTTLSNYTKIGGSKELVQLFDQTIQTKIISNGLLNVLELHRALEDERFASLFYAQYNHNQYQKIFGLTNRLINLNKLLVVYLRDAKDKLLNQESYNRLKQLKDDIETALSKHTEKSLLNDFENQE